LTPKAAKGDKSVLFGSGRAYVGAKCAYKYTIKHWWIGSIIYNCVKSAVFGAGVVVPGRRT